MSQLKQVKRTFEECKSEVERNKDFEYAVIKTRKTKEELPGGLCVLNCLCCNYTCLEKFTCINDDDKRKCSAIGSDGNCKICPDKWSWQSHAATRYKFTFDVNKVKKDVSR